MVRVPLALQEIECVDLDIEQFELNQEQIRDSCLGKMRDKMYLIEFFVHTFTSFFY